MHTAPWGKSRFIARHKAPVMISNEGPYCTTQNGLARHDEESGCAVHEKNSCQVMVQGLAAIALKDDLQFRVKGSCMGSLLVDGGSVKLASRSCYWPGDVVVAWWPEKGFCLHRGIGGYRKNGAWKLLTQADAADTPDYALPKAHVVGRVGGGDCDHAVVRVPVRHRLWALGRFAAFIISTLVSKPHGLW